jgi:hypothetical protein
MPTQRQQREWARLGAMARLQQLEQERRVILSTFPDLRRTASAPSRGGSLPGRKLSADAKKRMSEGMRKWWAKRRARSGKGARPTA